MKRKKILLLPGAYYSPSARYRIIQFYPFLEQLGYHIKIRYPYPDRVLNTNNISNKFWKNIHPRLSQIIRLLTTLYILRDVGKFDIVISNRDLVPDLKIKFLEKFILKKKVKLIIDFDDSIYLGSRKNKMDGIFTNASYLVAGNEVLKNYAKKYNKNISIIPTVVNTDIFKPKPNLNIKDKVVIGWMGSKGPTILHLPLVFEALKKIVREYPIQIEFLFVSDFKPKIPDEIENLTKFEYWTGQNEVEMLQKMDIGLMPLPDSEFERGKCGFKAIQYMSVGIPAIVSPVGVNSSIVEHGIDGFHCKNELEWFVSISKLIEDKTLRDRMGLNAREKIIEFYSLNSAIVKWKRIIDNI